MADILPDSILGAYTDLRETRAAYEHGCRAERCLSGSSMDTVDLEVRLGVLAGGKDHADVLFSNLVTKHLHAHLHDAVNKALAECKALRAQAGERLVLAVHREVSAK